MDWQIREAAADFVGADIEVRNEFVEELSPQISADRALALGEDCDSICITSAVHPVVIEAVDALQRRGLPVFTFVAQLSATGLVHYVGLDNRKVGRASASAIAKLNANPGKIGILMGSPRYRNQDERGWFPVLLSRTRARIHLS